MLQIILGAISSDDINITVIPIQNIPPKVNAGNDINMSVNQTYKIIGNATDSDGQIVSYEWKENGTILSTTSTLDYIPYTTGIHTLTFTAKDDYNDTSSDDVNITVNPIMQEIELCNGVSAYVNMKYKLGMLLNDGLVQGNVISQKNNFVGATLCGDFHEYNSSNNILTSLKNKAFPSAKSIIINNNPDGSIKAKYELQNINKQAYAELKSILENSGNTDFSNYIDYTSFPTSKNLYIDLYIKYIDSSTVYLITAISDNLDTNLTKELKVLVDYGTIASSGIDNLDAKTDVFKSYKYHLKTDVLFVMDDSGSMSDEQSAAAKAIVDTFGPEMKSKGVDWKATVIGTENGRDYTDKYISDPCENNITKLASQLKLGTNGGDEVGLKIAYNYLSNGDITVRPNSRLSIIYISDEPAHSKLNELGGTDFRDSYFVENNIKLNVIIQEQYSNNNNLAYAMANATGGEIANIYNYENGYDTMMQKVANNAAGASSQIILTETPIVPSIQLAINGVMKNTGWEYDIKNKTIIFDALSIPLDTDTITVTYNY